MCRIFSLSLLSCLLLAGQIYSQTAGAPLSGTVSDQSGALVEGAEVTVKSSGAGEIALTAITDSKGTFRFKRLPAGEYRIEVRAQGFAGYETTKRITDRPVSLGVRLAIEPLSQVVQVAATLDDLADANTISGSSLREKQPKDLVQSLRGEPGVFAVRRGPINLEPEIRGLAESEVGMFVDGTRTFAAGPGRMDSDLSHVSFHDVQEVKVTKGPFALTTGSGTMSAVEVKTFSPPFYSDRTQVHATGGFDYGSNGVFRDGYGTVWAGGSKLRASLSHNVRLGNDYRAGDGTLVAGDFRSNDSRATVGFKPSSRTFVEYKFGFQEQNDIDYEGRVLDATYFITRSHSLAFDYTPAAGFFTRFFALLYSNNKGHLMNNDNKPTAQPMPGRVPPFAIRVDLPTRSRSLGGNYFATARYKGFDLKFGGDFYDLDQHADRFVSRRDTGMLLFSDIVWGNARTNDQGYYFNMVRRDDRLSLGGTVRIDLVQANAERASDFFLEHAGSDLSRDEFNVSAALGSRIRVNEYVSVFAGVGRSVRTATALERYSDRFPATKFQTSAEFLGNPALKPEASLELDAGLSAKYKGLSVGADFFVRRLDDYITIMADPTIPKRLPLSPPIVFRYINGTSALFRGLDLKVGQRLGRYVDARATLSYVRGEDRFLSEPVIGMPPLQATAGLQLHSFVDGLLIDLSGTFAAKQDRVAVSRFEIPTSGYAVFDLRGSYRLLRRLRLNAALENMGDRYYSNHLNSLNPFTGRRIPEAGRSFRIGLGFDL